MLARVCARDSEQTLGRGGQEAGHLTFLKVRDPQKRTLQKAYQGVWLSMSGAKGFAQSAESVAEIPRFAALSRANCFATLDRS